MIITREYFRKIFNRNNEIKQDCVNNMKEKKKVFEIADSIVFTGFENTVNKLKQYESLYIIGILLNMLKLLDRNNRFILFIFIKDQIE